MIIYKYVLDFVIMMTMMMMMKMCVCVFVCACVCVCVRVWGVCLCTGMDTNICTYTNTPLYVCIHKGIIYNTAQHT